MSFSLKVGHSLRNFISAMFFGWLNLDQYDFLSPKNYIGARTRPKEQEKNFEKFRQHVGAKLRKTFAKIRFENTLKVQGSFSKTAP